MSPYDPKNVVHPTVEDVSKPKWLTVPDWNTLKSLAAIEDRSCSEIMRSAVEAVLVKFLLEMAEASKCDRNK